MMNSFYQHYHNFQLFDVVKLAEIEINKVQIAERKIELIKVKEITLYKNLIIEQSTNNEKLTREIDNVELWNCQCL